MAIVSRFSAEKAKSIKKTVKQSLTQRIRQKVGISDDSNSSSGGSESEDSEDDARSTGTRASKPKSCIDTVPDSPTDQDATLRGNSVSENNQDVDHSEGVEPEPGSSKPRFRLRRKKSGKRMRREHCKRKKQGDIETGEVPQDTDKRSGGFGLSSNEQTIPADAILAKQNANEVFIPSIYSSYQNLTSCPQFLQILDPAIMPLGIITLEDVLEGTSSKQSFCFRVLKLIDRAHRGGDLR